MSQSLIISYFYVFFGPTKLWLNKNQLKMTTFCCDPLFVWINFAYYFAYYLRYKFVIKGYVWIQNSSLSGHAGGQWDKHQNSVWLDFINMCLKSFFFIPQVFRCKAMIQWYKTSVQLKNLSETLHGFKSRKFLNTTPSFTIYTFLPLAIHGLVTQIAPSKCLTIRIKHASIALSVHHYIHKSMVNFFAAQRRIKPRFMWKWKHSWNDCWSTEGIFKKVSNIKIFNHKFLTTNF